MAHDPQVLATDEPLALSAPLAARLAEAQCRLDPAVGWSCAWSHGFWQYLRLLGLAVTPDRHAAFLQSALAEVADSRPRARLLISGAVDYAMLAQVAAVWHGRGAMPEITVLDICDTPLELNRWYAERSGFNIRTVKADILEFASPRPFDAICTHAFLGFFDHARRKSLAAKWYSLLSTGGRAITVHRLRPGESELVLFTENQIQAYVETVTATARGIAPLPGLDDAALAGLAERYARRLRFYAVPTLHYVDALFRQAGFAIERLFAAPLGGNVKTAGSASTVPGDNPYFHLVATRR